MNYKHTKIIECEDKIFNLENWISCEVITNGSIRKDENNKPIYEPLLTIEFPGDHNKIYMTYTTALNKKIWVLLGLPAGKIEEMFLKAEIKDDGE